MQHSPEDNAVEDNAVENNVVEDNAIENNAVEDNAVEDNAIENNAMHADYFHDELPDYDSVAPDQSDATVARVQYYKGRGAVTNPGNRYATHHVERDSEDAVDNPVRPATQLLIDTAKTIIATNKSPDVPFTQSINPYKGCEHGCIYCFARPTHAYWDLSPGLDFETKILYKPNGPELLEQALAKPGYRCSPIAFGSNTDPYQPIDKQTGLTRQLLQVLQRYRHPFTLVTKGSHVERDMDIFQDMAQDNLCSVMISLTTLSNDLKRRLEPRTASPHARLKIIAQLAAAKIPVGVLVAPVIPMINDAEIEQLLESAQQAGAQSASYILLRLPLEVKDMFSDWLHTHFPERAQHVLSLIRQSRDGKLNHAEFGQRMRGTGVYADLINQRFKRAAQQLGLLNRESGALNCELFVRPAKQSNSPQLSLFS